MAELIAHSLLEAYDPVETRGIRVSGRPYLGMLRVQYSERQAAEELASLLALDLPQPGYYTQTAGQRLHWLTPNEYLVVTEPGSESSVLQALAPLAASDTNHISVLSDARVTLEVSGARVTDLLSQGCSLDLYPSRFGVGATTVTRFAQLPLMLSKTGDCRFELTVDRAYARYLRDWIVDAIDGI